MGATLMIASLVLTILVAAPQSATAGENNAAATVDSLVFPHILVAVQDDDSTSRTLRFVFNGGSSLRVNQESIDRVIDETETPGRVYITFTATSESDEELEKFHSWNFDRARRGVYHAKPGERSIHPEVKILLTFPSVAEETKYVMGFTDREDDGTIYRPPTSTAQFPSDQESNDVESTR